MNLSPEKQKHYEQLYEEMYQESIRTGHTPVPAELNNPAERRSFLNWRHEFWVNVSGRAAMEYRQWLSKPQVSGVALAETTAPFPSQK